MNHEWANGAQYAEMKLENGSRYPIFGKGVSHDRHNIVSYLAS
jgi:hypothetical protein